MLLRGVGSETVGRNGKIVSQGVDYYDDRAVEALGMPASVRLWDRAVIRTSSTLRFIVQHQSGEKKAFCEEEDADYVHDTASVSWRLL